jgi:hypothetical protein
VALRAVIYRVFALLGSALLLLAVVSLDSDSAAANHAGGADNFLIDMDPAGNTATSIGSIESCARINENNIQDADEDAIDRILIDVVTGPLGIPAGSPMGAFSFGLGYPTPQIMVVAEDQLYLLASAPLSGFFIDASEDRPDNDGLYLAAGLVSTQIRTLQHRKQGRVFFRG